MAVIASWTLIYVNVCVCVFVCVCVCISSNGDTFVVAFVNYVMKLNMLRVWDLKNLNYEE